MTTTPQPSNITPIVSNIDREIEYPLSSLFSPNDFYYYNAQFPMGIEFLGSVFGIDFVNDPKYSQYSDKNFLNPNASVPSCFKYTTKDKITYSIPYPIMKDACSNRNKLVDDISSALIYYFKNTAKIDSSTNTNNNIEYGSPKYISITDNEGVTYTYNPSTDNSTSENYFNLNQNIVDYSFFGDFNMNVVNSKNFEYVQVDGDTNTFGEQTYYSNIIPDSNNNVFVSTEPGDINNSSCLTRIIPTTSGPTTSGPTTFGQNANFEYQVGTECSGTTSIKKQSNANLFIQNLKSMSFDVFPDYSSVNIYNNSTLDNEQSSSGNKYDPNSTKLVEKIADYYIELCKNAEIATKYQNLVNGVVTNASDQLYQSAIDNYYREYGKIINISVGIFIGLGVLYKISTNQ